MCLAMPLLYNHQVQNRMRRVGIVCLHALRFACERIEGSGLGGGDGGGNRGERLVSTCATGNSSEHEPSHRKLFTDGNFCNGVPTIDWTCLFLFYKGQGINVKRDWINPLSTQLFVNLSFLLVVTCVR